jgi:DNA mismatch repair protein MutL
MNRIRLLPEQVANQIAAGEVVERPASVVKELVENALDAGAGRVTLEIQAGGRSLIRVTDDGTGMSRDDALLCLERHATSKIRKAEDLASIATMGFRGEALPSIASVSRFTLTTRERDSDSPEGTQVIINGGKIADVRAAGSATGTCVEVRQLFFNLPARRKFLRSEETESAHIQHYFLLAALAFPGVAFTFLKDGRTVWQLPAVVVGGSQQARLTALRERMRGLYGADQSLLPVDFSATLAVPTAPDDEAPDAPPSMVQTPFQVWGLIGAPGVSRATREDQHLFVNRRPVENRGLNHALMEGYHTALMKGRYPVCCLFLDIDPSAVDVNIHPAKREVKFHREYEIRRMVAQAVRQALLAFTTAPGQQPSGNASAPSVRPVEPVTPQFSQPALLSGKPETQTVSPADFKSQISNFKAERTELAPAPPPSPARSDIPNAPAAPAPAAGITPHSALRTPQNPATAPDAAPINPQSAIRNPQSEAPQSEAPQSAIRNPQLPVPLLQVPLRLVGVIGRLYVVLESDRGLVLLDQHAAHERILFEQMLERMEREGSAPSQRLLLPETLELAPRDAQFLREHMPVLVRLGVGVSEFGERTFLLDGLPPFVKTASPRQFMLDLVDELKAAGREVNTLRIGEHVVAKTVCRHAVKAHDPLAGRELENLIEDLQRCAMPYTCPHGRPTLIEMSFRELEKKFGRAE